MSTWCSIAFGFLFLCGFGFIAAGYLRADDLAARLAATRELTDRPFGVNLFVPGEPASPGAFEAYAEEVEADAASRGMPVGAARYDDDDWEAKLELLCDDGNHESYQRSQMTSIPCSSSTRVMLACSPPTVTRSRTDGGSSKFDAGT